MNWQIILYSSLVLLIFALTGFIAVYAWRRTTHFRLQDKTLEALRASEEKFRLAFDTSPDSVAITRMKDGMFVSVNKGFEQISGYSQEEIIGKTMLEVNIWKNPEDRQKVIMKLRTGEEVRNYEAIFLTRNGEIHGLLSSALIELNGEPHILNITRDITARKQAEENYHSIFENALEGIFQSLPNGKFITVNPALAHMLGYESPNELIETIKDIANQTYVEPQRRAEFLQIMAEKKLIDNFQSRIKCKDGRIIWISESAHTIFDEEGKIRYYEGSVEDITARKKTEEALHESEARYRSLIENVGEGIGFVDDQERLMFVNPAGHEIFGMKPNSLVGHNLREFTAPDQFDLILDETQTRKAGEKSVYELKITRPDGENRNMLVTAVPQFDSNGEFVGTLGVFRDLTERKQAEEKIAQAEKHFQALIENAPDGVVLLGLNGKYKYASPSALKIFNYDAEDMLTHSPNEDTHPDDLPAVLAALQELIQNPSMVPVIQYRFKHKDGSWHWVESTFTNLLGEPSVAAIVINFHDITERKQAEKKLHDGEEQLRIAHDAAELGTWKEYIPTLTFQFDERAQKHYDLDEAYVPIQTIAARVHPEDAHLLRKEIEASTGAPIGDRFTTEYRIIHRDGTVHWVAVHARLHYEEHDGKQTPVMVLGTSQDITRRKDAEQQLLQRTQQLRLVNEATRSLNVSLKASHVYEVIYTSISQLMPCDTLFVSSFDAASQMISLVSGWHDGQPMDVSRYEPIPLEPEGSGTQSQSIRTKESLLISDFQARLKNTKVVHNFDENSNPVEESPEDGDIPRSALVVPLIVESRVIGVIQVFSYKANAYTEDNLQTLNGFCAQASISLSNAQLYEHLQRENFERKQAEKALRESEQKYRLLFDEMLSGIAIHELICDPQGKPIDYRFIAINAAFEKMTGLTSTSVIGKRVLEVMPSTEAYWIERYGQVALTRIPIQFENYSAELGKHFEVRAFSPEPGKFATIFHDITERKQAEEKLNSAYELQQNVQDSLSAHIATLDHEGNVVQVNSAWRNFAAQNGLQHPNYGIGMNYLQVCDAAKGENAEEAAVTARAIREVLGGAQKETRFEYPCHAPNEKRWFIANITSFENNGQKWIVISHEDITMRKQAEIDIKERTEDLELINALNEAVNRGDNLKKVMEVFSEGLRKIGIYKDSTIYLLSPDGQNLTMQHLGIPPGLLKKIEQLTHRSLPILTIPIEESGSFQRSLLTGQSIIQTDPQKIQNRIMEFIEASPLPTLLRSTIRKLIPQIYKLLDVRSALIVPLISDNQVIGLIDVSSAEVMTEKDLHRVQKISGQLTAVIMQEQANMALLESEKRYRSIFDGVQDAIFVEAKDGRILEVNNSACEMYGYKRDEFLEKTVSDIIPEENTVIPIHGAQANISHMPIETIARRANGNLFPAEVSRGLQSINGEEMLLMIVRDVTKRKQAEEALNESKLLFHLLIESLPQNIYAKDTDGRFIFANQNYCVSQGCSLEEILGKTDFELHPTELAEKYLLDDRWVIETGKTIELEEEHQPLGGKKTYVEVIKTPFSYSKEQPAGILGIFWDITERRQTEDGIRQRVKSLELLYENSQVLNQSLNPKEISQKVIELLGEKLDWHHTAICLLNEQDNSLELTAFDLQGIEGNEEKENLAHLSKLITRIGDGLSGWAILQSQTLRSGDVNSDPHYVASYPGIHSGMYAPLKSGERTLGVISIESEKPNAFSEADEQLITTLANQAAIALDNARLYREISRHAEELEQHVQERTAEIESTRQRLELAAKTAGIGIWEVDINQNKDYWDDRLFALYGLSSQSSTPQSQTWHNAVHPDDLEQQIKLMDDALHKNKSYDTEFRVIWPDQSLHYIKSTGAVIYGKTGKAERIIGANQDITIHKQAEEALSLANAEMERNLRMKTEFLATMSHELRTPLNSILGISESLEEQISGSLNDKQIKYVRIIIESGRHLLELINDILDLSKIEAGKFELTIQTVTVEKLCTASLRMVKELAQKKSLNVSFKMDETAQYITGDERRLKQILVNLLSNAVKFTPQGREIGLEVKGRAETHELMFTVWDKGIGIDEEDKKHLFQPFVQLKSGLAREYGGTGLGLALVAQMVRLHGGHITLESRLNAGSRFTVSLPWNPLETEKPAPFRFPVTTEAPIRGTSSGAKVLIVEDTEVVAQLVSEYLRHKGYETYIAHNGRDGLFLAKQERPQIILMDIMMPIMNGLQAAKAIRADDSLKHIPIIGLTALAMSTDREQCLAAGMNDHLSKPIEMQELARIIEHYLRQNG